MSSYRTNEKMTSAALSCRVQLYFLSSLTSSCSIRPCHVLSYPVLTCPLPSCPIPSYPLLLFPVLFYPVLLYSVPSYPVRIDFKILFTVSFRHNKMTTTMRSQLSDTNRNRMVANSVINWILLNIEEQPQ